MTRKILFIIALVCSAIIMSFRHEHNAPASFNPHLSGQLTDSLFEGSNGYFASSGKCDHCHGLDGAGIASVDMEGSDVNLVDDWRSTMMANSARDPFWRAKVSHEVFINPDHQVELESTCTRCHAPLGNYAAILTGAEHYSMAEMLLDSVALDGVSCLACHQRSPENLSGHTGQMHFATSLVAYGQYPDPLVTPMALYSGYTPEYGAHIAQAEICGSCHSLITNTVDLSGQLTGDEFVEQATWHEWLNSSYPEEGTTCQTCHMPSLGEQGVILAAGYDTPPRTPFSLHTLVGGNVLMLGIFRDNAESLGLTATPDHFQSTINATVQNLQQQSLQLEVSELNRDSDTTRVRVKLTNITGHKLPSGYPARRMVLKVSAFDENGNELWSSGKYTSDYRVEGEDLTFEPHHQVITEEDQCQIYEMVMGDVNGNVTTILERGFVHLKDNRLVPEGFSMSDEMYDTTEVVLGIPDEDFNYDPLEGSGTDVVYYHIPTDGYTGPVSITAEVHYQSIPPRWLDEMFADSTPEIETFEALYNAADKSPVLMRSADIAIPEYVGIGQETATVTSVVRAVGSRLWCEVPRTSTISIYNSNGQLLHREKEVSGSLWIAPQCTGMVLVVVESNKKREVFRVILR